MLTVQDCIDRLNKAAREYDEGRKFLLDKGNSENAADKYLAMADTCRILAEGMERDK